jgi:hypothetical protein
MKAAGVREVAMAYPDVVPREQRREVTLRRRWPHRRRGEG